MTGLDRAELPDPAITAQDELGVDYLYRILSEAARRPVTLRALGSLTNTISPWS